MSNKMSHAQAVLIDSTLESLATLDDILTSPSNGPTKVHPQALYAYATDPDYQPDATLEYLLTTDAKTLADFQRMLKNTARYFMPRMAAASSGDIDMREVDGLEIQFRQSHANSDQVYTILKTVDIDASPKILLVKQANGKIARLTLPKFLSGQAQILLERQDPILIGLMDINSEVYVS